MSIKVDSTLIRSVMQQSLYIYIFSTGNKLQKNYSAPNELTTTNIDESPQHCYGTPLITGTWIVRMVTSLKLIGSYAVCSCL